MFNVGGGEVLVILIAALIVLGPDKLPNAARQVGKYLAEFRKISQGFQDELRAPWTSPPSPDPEPVAYPPAEPARAEPGAVRGDRRRGRSRPPRGQRRADGTPSGVPGPRRAGDRPRRRRPETAAYEMPATMTPTTRPEATPTADPGGDAPPIHDVGPTGPTAA